MDDQEENQSVYKHAPSFLRLFRYEFDELFNYSNFVVKLKRGINHYAKPEPGTLLHQLVKSDKVEFDDVDKERLFRALRNIDDSCANFWNWYLTMLLFVTNPEEDETRDPLLHFMLTNKPPKDAEHFKKFFDPAVPIKLDIIADLLLPKPLFSAMEASGPEVYTKMLKSHVVPRWNEKFNNFYYGIAEFLRRLFYCDPGRYNEKERSWYMDFLCACKKNVANGTLLSFIDPYYHDGLEFYVVRLKTENREIGGLTNEDYVTADMERKARFRPPPTYILNDRFFAIEDEIPNAITLRSYQQELVRYAKEGDNTIICAPTGSGKTIVAVEIIRNHLEIRNNQNGLIVQKSRVAFIVPTVPLVEQQSKVIKDYLGTNFNISGFSGSDNLSMNERAHNILQSHVIVITPQMLVNLLQNVNKNRRLYVADFSLFVLDECHHCGAKHPYEIMMKLVRQYIDETVKYNLDREVPQVVGLTASLGADSSVYNTERTQNKILGLCVRMLATQLSTVRTKRNLQELRSHVNPPIDQICRCQRSRDDEFHKLVCTMMNKIIDEIKPTIEKNLIFSESLKQFKFPEVHEWVFCAAIDRLKDSRKTWPDELAEDKIFVGEACDQLKAYAKVIQMNNLLPASYAFQYMEIRFNEFFDGKREHLFEELHTGAKDQLFELKEKDRGDTKEILNKLKGIIREEYSMNPETRTLIFVETRYLAVFLSDFLNKSGALKEFHNECDEFAAYLTSTNAAQKFGGLSPIEQRTILSKFGQGDFKVLVVTSVAEEGLDISACNLIIKYNTVGSERTMIQRRGRARALDSKSVLVCLDEDVEQRELTNIMREINMKLCLQDLQSRSVEQLQALIEERRQLALAEEQRTAEEKKRQAAAIEEKLYDVQCAQCHHTLCKSDQIRTVLDTHFCSVDPKIWTNIGYVFDETKTSAEQNIIVCAPFKCKTCESIMGNIIKYADVFLPSIKHTAIALQESEMIVANSRDTVRITRQKWIDIQEKYFVVEPISVETLVGLHKMLSQCDPDTLEQLQLHSEFAIQHQMEKLQQRQMRKTRYRLTDYGDAE